VTIGNSASTQQSDRLGNAYSGRLPDAAIQLVNMEYPGTRQDEAIELAVSELTLKETLNLRRLSKRTS
jgi:hypothetical protein